MNNIIFIPAISIIIPLYNAEKYIAQCLRSILSQTFQDFEVIVVDDCSTDHSIDIVEKIIESHNEKIKLIKNRKNSGGSAIPRNIGLRLSRGKYILFIDNDDMIVNNALEILYNIAEQTQADVLHAEKWFEPQNKIEKIDKNTKFIINTFEKGGFVDKITIESENLEDRIKLYCQKRFFWHVWNKLFRRDFLIENDIKFPPILTGEDTMFCFFCLCFAKNYVRIPNTFNIWRIRENSVSHKFDSMKNYLHKFIKFFLECTKILSDFMDEIKFFKQNTNFKYMVIDFFIRDHWFYFDKIYDEYTPEQIYTSLCEEFSSFNNDNKILASFMFNYASIYRLKLIRSQQKILMMQKN